MLGFELDSTLLCVMDRSVDVLAIVRHRTGAAPKVRCSLKRQKSVNVSGRYLLFGTEQLGKLERNAVRIRDPVVSGTSLSWTRLHQGWARPHWHGIPLFI